MSTCTITQRLWQQDRDEIFFMLSQYDTTEEIQHYVSTIKKHYTQLKAQYPGLDTRVLLQHLEEVRNKVSLYRAKVQPAMSVHKIENICSTTTSISGSNIRLPSRTPPQIKLNRGSSGPRLWQSSVAAPPRLDINLAPASAVPHADSSQSSSDAPPPYTPRVTLPAGDRLAALPPIPAWSSNIVFAPGTFDGYTSEEIIKHYRPQIHRLVLEGLRSQVGEA